MLNPEQTEYSQHARCERKNAYNTAACSLLYLLG
eukprot:COSAG01_NODE_68517_length_264_cov_0.527273_1_plen_33_part_01